VNLRFVLVFALSHLAVMALFAAPANTYGAPAMNHAALAITGYAARYAAPAPAVTYATPGPAVNFLHAAPAPAATYRTSAELCRPTPAVTYAAPAPTVTHAACSLEGVKGEPGWINQDVCIRKHLNTRFLLVGVFDGHGPNGHLIAARARTLFEEAAQRHVEAGMAIPFSQVFTGVHAILQQEGLAQFSGTTASVAVVDTVASTVVTAYVGDSKVMIIHGNKVVHETSDHKFDPETEWRIRAQGGEVRESGGCRRIYGRGSPSPGLAMSRSLGDTEAHQAGAVAEPTVSNVMQLHPGSTVILASDGVWDVLPVHVVIEEAMAVDVERITRTLVAKARGQWEQGNFGHIDDISAVVVQLNQGRAKLPSFHNGGAVASTHDNLWEKLLGA